ncbi:uncharacterized protein LODBEIA_P09560 [Lodderomyces beijingensis]|uniref:Peptide transporter PTR2 n=1 Tax=Lodderomyces beijingensis TaxID=1775926 RepID=A0ABP0ZF00_9ASCO
MSPSVEKIPTAQVTAATNASSSSSSSSSKVDLIEKVAPVIQEEQEIYDYDDSLNYTTHYVDEYNPKGLRKPTDEEAESLRRVLGDLKWPTYLLCLAELAERASYYSCSNLVVNFIMRPKPQGSRWGAPVSTTSDESAGALGQGLQTATALTLLLTFLAYVIPLYGGFVADAHIGKFKAINYGVWIGGVAHLLFIIAAIPPVMDKVKASLAVIVLAIITLAIGTGLIKPNLLPLLLDQYPETTDVVKVLPTGESVIVDRQKTYQRMTLIFYWSINIGAFFQLATSYCARRVGFWLAFFVPMIMYLFLPAILWWVRPQLKVEEPQGSLLTNAARIFKITFSGNFIKRWKQGSLWEYAKPTNMYARGVEYYNTKKQTPITWTDQWVLDMKQTVNACKIFVYYIVFNLAASGIGSVTTSLVGSMSTKGVPNDLFNNFNPLTIIILLPILDKVVYPFLRRHKIEFRPIWRIALGLTLGALGQACGAILQDQVYKTSPCGQFATTCDRASPISAWAATSIYCLGAAGECFANTTAYEISYTRSPPHMKGLVMAMFLFMSSISAMISQATLPALVDPYLVYPFIAITVIAFAAAILILIQFRNLHKVMEVERLERERMEREEKQQREESKGTGNAIEAVVSRASAAPI